MSSFILIGKKTFDKNIRFAWRWSFQVPRQAQRQALSLEDEKNGRTEKFI